MPDDDQNLPIPDVVPGTEMESLCESILLSELILRSFFPDANVQAMRQVLMQEPILRVQIVTWEGVVKATGLRFSDGHYRLVRVGGDIEE